MKSQGNIMIIESIDGKDFTTLVEDAIDKHNMEISSTKILSFKTKDGKEIPYYAAIMIKRRPI